METVKEYDNEMIKVIWKPDLCTHSKRCWKGLLLVFNPIIRPWININGADAQVIAEQVRLCPSGALSFEFRGDLATK